MERYDALSVRESNGKAYFTKVGVAFPSKSGDGFSILLDAIPAPVDGQFKILLKTPKPRDGDTMSQHNQAKANGYQPQPIDLNDEVPF